METNKKYQNDHLSNYLRKYFDKKDYLGLVKNKIIDQVLLGFVVYLLLVILNAYFRQASFNWGYKAFFLSFTIIFPFLFLYALRNKTPFLVKAAVVVALLTVGVVRFLIYNGGYTMAYLVFPVIFIILFLFFRFRVALLISILITTAVPIIGWLFVEGYLTINPIEYEARIVSPYNWANDLLMVLLSLFISFNVVGAFNYAVMKHEKLTKRKEEELKVVIKGYEKELMKSEFSENELIRSEAKFKSLFESNLDGIALILDYKFIEVNTALLGLLGYKKKELINKDIFKIIDRRFINKLKFQIELMMEGNSQPALEVSLVHKDGHYIPVELTNNLMLSDSGIMYLSTIRDIRHRQRMQKEKLEAVVKSEEAERARLSKELHDGIGPIFSSIKLFLQTLAAQEKDGSKQDILQKVSEMADRGVKETRQVSHNLSPYLLDKVGIVEAIKTHIHEFSNAKNLNITFKSDKYVKVEKTKEVVLYRICLELLNNTIKYAEASSVIISIYQTNNWVIFIYADNGKGFDFNKLENYNGIGLKNIESRVNSLNGSIDYSYKNHILTTKIELPI